MKDFNFFEPYIASTKKKDKKQKKSPILRILVVLFWIAVILVPSYIYGTIYLDRQAIDEMEIELSKPKMKDALQRVQTKRIQINQLNELNEDLFQIDKTLAGTEVLTEYQMQAIVAAIPENIYIDSLEMSGEKVSIFGYGHRRSAIAEFELNIRKSGIFQAVLLESIESVQAPYSYTLIITPKKVVE